MGSDSTAYFRDVEETAVILPYCLFVVPFSSIAMALRQYFGTTRVASVFLDTSCFKWDAAAHHVVQLQNKLS